MSAAARRWAERIESGTFTMAQARQFGKAVVRRAEGLRPAGARSNLTDAEAVSLLAFLRERGGVLLDDTSDLAGQEWLSRNGRRTFGPNWPTDRVAAGSAFFEYHGEVHHYGSHEYRGEDYGDTLPVWRLVLDDGATLTYWRCPWQSYQSTDEPRQGWSWQHPHPPKETTR